MAILFSGFNQRKALLLAHKVKRSEGKMISIVILSVLAFQKSVTEIQYYYILLVQATKYDMLLLNHVAPNSCQSG